MFPQQSYCSLFLRTADEDVKQQQLEIPFFDFYNILPQADQRAPVKKLQYFSVSYLILMIITLKKKIDLYHVFSEANLFIIKVDCFTRNY